MSKGKGLGRSTAVERRALIAVIPLVWLIIMAITFGMSSKGSEGPTAAAPDSTLVASVTAAASADSLAVDSLRKPEVKTPSKGTRSRNGRRSQSKSTIHQPSSSKHDTRNPLSEGVATTISQE